jgi:hypothetical protein
MGRNNARKVDAYLYSICLQHLSTACIYSMYRTDGVQEGVNGPLCACTVDAHLYSIFLQHVPD